MREGHGELNATALGTIRYQGRSNRNSSTVIGKRNINKRSDRETRSESGHKRAPEQKGDVMRTNNGMSCNMARSASRDRGRAIETGL